MDIQKELEAWAEKTVIAYHQIASRTDVNIAYYTQSDLSLLSNEPELMIVGINPGSVSSYIDQCNNKNWSYLYKDPLDKNHLLKGNYCKEEGKPSSWESHRKWRYWSGLKNCLSQTALSSVMDDDSKIIVTNASFFNTQKANEIRESLLFETIKYTLDLINKTNPKNIIFLSGKKCFERLSRLSKSSQLFQFKYKHICGNIYVGILNNKCCIGIPHPTYKTSEELKLIASVLPFLINITNYENINIKLICKECHKQIKEYEDRICNNKNSSDSKIRKHAKISNLNGIVQQIISKAHLIPYEEKNHRYKLNDKYGITITESKEGYMGIRHINYNHKSYDNAIDKEVITLKETLEKRGYNISESTWIATKRFKDFGNNEDEIVKKILSEINDIVKYVS